MQITLQTSLTKHWEKVTQEKTLEIEEALEVEKDHYLHHHLK
jgi:hypothetical protein